MKVAEIAKSLVHLPKYKARDITGDDIPETFCNYFVADTAYLVGCNDFSPTSTKGFPKLANEMVSHMCDTPHRWKELDPDQAQQEANFGNLVIAGWANDVGKHGHVNIIIPGILTWSKQFGDDVPNSVNVGGSSNYYGRPVSYGFKQHMVPRYWLWLKAKEEGKS